MTWHAEPLRLNPATLGRMSGNLFESAAPSAGDAGSDWFTAHCDGGSRGNPGPAGYGAVVEDPQRRPVVRLSRFLGRQTNNYAEYSGLLAVLAWAIEHGVKRLRVISDSELMVNQMKGRYKVASPALRPLWEEAKRLAGQLERFEIRHTLRGGNQEADRLANAAMDEGTKASRQAASPRGEAGGARLSGGMTFRTAEQKSGAGTAKPVPQVLEGYVKGGVIHLLDGELPDGIFVKIIREKV